MLWDNHCLLKPIITTQCPSLRDKSAEHERFLEDYLRKWGKKVYEERQDPANIDFKIKPFEYKWVRLS
jgi:hypothetical protein